MCNKNRTSWIKCRVGSKLISQTGESLIEVLAALLIASLSLILLVTGVQTAVNINRNIKVQDEQLASAWISTQERAPYESGTLKISDLSGSETESYTISINENEFSDGLYAFWDAR